MVYLNLEVSKAHFKEINWNIPFALKTYFNQKLSHIVDKNSIVFPTVKNYIRHIYCIKIVIHSNFQLLLAAITDRHNNMEVTILQKKADCKTTQKDDRYWGWLGVEGLSEKERWTGQHGGDCWGERV